jgi:hypothetical protein
MLLSAFNAAHGSAGLDLLAIDRDLQAWVIERFR